MEKVFESFKNFKDEYLFDRIPQPLIEYASFIEECLGDFGIINNQKIITESMDEGNAIRLITKAISEMKYISLYYDDKDSDEEGFRLVEPFVLGKGFKYKGKPSEGLEDVYYLRAYVVRESDKDVFVDQKIKKIGIKSIGSKISDKGNSDWRLFRIDKIAKIQILDINFEFERPFYNPNDKSFIEIITSVSKSSLNDPKKYNVSSTNPDINFTYDYVS
jgi:hypothetical protein